MSESSRWSFPAQLQPTQGEVSFDLKTALDGVVSLRSEVPDDAFTASILGTERLGNGVVIRSDGLVLTIGYLITEASSVWLTGNDGTVVQGFPLAYDFATGFGLVQPLGRANEGAVCEDRPHRRPPRVMARPCMKGIFGCHPSIRFALVMSRL